MKKAFTLAEVMIVLAIIGILVAILLPTAQNLAPDETILKFKKANSSLTTAIREVVHNEKYFYNGDLGLDRDGNLVSNPKYFCSVLSDVLNIKSSNCSDDNLGYNSSAVANLPDLANFDIDNKTIFDYADCMCKNNLTSGEEIILNDNTIIYIINPYYHFGSLVEGSDKRLFNLCSKEKRYKFICMDIDGTNQGEDPFGYAIRTDGKVIYGSRAQAWIKASINNNEEYLSTIPATNTCAPIALAITPENDVCKVAQQPAVTPTPTPEPEPTCIPSENCKTCDPNTNLCIECEEGYELKEGVCEIKSPCEDVDCGELAMCIEVSNTKGLCVTKYNIGDKEEFPIPITVSKVTYTSCNSSKCCWTGTTSDDCNSYNGGYNGCTRTVCTWGAAQELCSQLTYMNKTWRLMTNDEMIALKNLGVKNISKGKGVNGLQLCDLNYDSSSARCNYSSRCTNSTTSYATYCYPSLVWGESYNSSTGYTLELSSGSLISEGKKPFYQGLSVRCASDLD